MRWTLVRYTSARTNWVPRCYALRDDRGRLLERGPDAAVVIFDGISEAIHWVRDNDPEGSVEWEGTQF